MDGSVSETLALIFNIVCFIPFGTVLSLLINKKAVVLCGFAFSLGVEIFQLFSGWGGFDFADLVLNTLGTFLGVVLYDVLFKKLSERAISITLCICLALIIPLDAYAIINTITHFPV